VSTRRLFGGTARGGAAFANVHYRAAPAEAIRTAVVESEDPVSEIIAQSAGADLVVLGATMTGRWRRMIRTSLPEEVAAKCPAPLVIMKAGRASGRERAVRRP